MKFCSDIVISVLYIAPDNIFINLAINITIIHLLISFSSHHTHTYSFQFPIMAGNFIKPLAGLARNTSCANLALTYQVRNVSLTAANIPMARYGGRHTVTMMPGDGIGPEMMSYVKEVYKHAGAPVDFETVTLDPSTDNYDDLYNAIASVKRNGCGIKGNIETKMNRPDIKSRNVEMRNELDLFVNRIHCKSQPGIKTRHEDIDVVVSP